MSSFPPAGLCNCLTPRLVAIHGSERRSALTMLGRLLSYSRAGARFLTSGLLLLLVLAGRSAAYLSVSPQSVPLTLAHGAGRRLTFLIANDDGADARTVRYFPASFIQKEDGSYMVVTDRDPAFSCRSWFKLDTGWIELGPNQGKEVTVQLAVPMTAHGTNYGAIVFEMLPKKTQSWAQVGVVFREPAFVEITTSGTRYRGKPELADLQVVPAREVQKYLPVKVREGSLGVVAALKNVGEVSFPARGQVVIRDAAGKRVREFPLSAGGTVLPGAEVKLVSITPALEPGDYTVETQLRYGAVSPVRAARAYSVGGGALSARGGIATAEVLPVVPNPERVEIRGRPGSFRSQYLVLRNEGDKDIELAARTGHLKSDLEGNLAESDSDEGASSCRDWMTIAPQRLVLPAGRSQPVRVSFDIPDRDSGGRYAAISLEPAASRSSELVRPSILVPVLVTLVGTERREASIRQILLNPTPLSVAVEIRNEGNVHIRPKGKAVILRTASPGTEGADEDNRVGVINLTGDAVVLPGRSVRLTGSYPDKLKSGTYRLALSVDCGEKLALTSSKDIVIP